MKLWIWISVGLLMTTSLGCMAQESSTTPAQGYSKLPILGSTDNPLSLPLLRGLNSYGAVASVTSNTVSVSNGTWTLNQFVFSAGVQNDTYEVEFLTGNLAGITYLITGNTQDTLTLLTNGDDLTNHRLGSIDPGDLIAVRPLWTVGQVFGNSDSTVVLTPFSTTPTLSSIGGGDCLMFPNNGSVGLEKPNVSEIGYVQGTGWRTNDDPVTDQEYTTLPDQSVFFIRRQSGDITPYILGAVPPVGIITPILGGNDTSGNDFFAGLSTPDPLSLNSTGLIDPNSEGQTVIGSSTLGQPDDELLSWSGRRGFNRAPDQVFYNVGGTWMQEGNSSTTVGTDFMLQPSAAYIIRKRPANGNVDWMRGP